MNGGEGWATVPCGQCVTTDLGLAGNALAVRALYAKDAEASFELSRKVPQHTLATLVPKPLGG